ncbi:hypothetical protein T484DRAFT_1780717 [Baffinella frigidus]|nr:hypothetical protein T484DRAFT_1780717 [Cryptophyta sp. CCMP2293]
MSCFKYSAGPFAVEIQASPKEVWAVLADFDGWQRWNPFMPKSRNLTRSDGAVQKGDMLESRLRDKMNFKTVITVAEPGKELLWSSPPNGMMDGDHYFQLEQNPSGSTTFTQGEDLSGCCIGCCYPCLGALIMNDNKKGFVEMNQALKAEVESKRVA